MAFGVDDLEVGGGATAVRGVGEPKGFGGEARGLVGLIEGHVGTAHRLEGGAHVAAGLAQVGLDVEVRLVGDRGSLVLLSVA